MSSPSKAATDDRVVYLFSSAPPDRPTYKRGVLNALCYPSGHQLELSYRKDYFQPPLFEQAQSLTNRKGVFVFVDYKGGGTDHKFVPIRFVKLLDVAPKEKALKYLDTTRVHVRIELADLIGYETRWNNEVARLPGRPTPHVSSSAGGRGYYYVIEGDNPFPSKNEISQRDIWDQITANVAQTKSLTNCLFLSTAHLRPFREGGPCGLKPYGDEQKAYSLEPNSIYRLDFRVRVFPQNVPKTSLDPEIVVRSSSDMVSVSQPFAPAVGSEDHSVLIACKRSIESVLATLVVDVAATDTPSGGVQSLTDVVAAKPNYMLAIEPPQSVVRWFVFLIFLGFLLTATSKEFYSDWVCRPEIWAVASKVIGAASLTRAAFLAFRKLPSGGSG